MDKVICFSWRRISVQNSIFQHHYSRYCWSYKSVLKRWFLSEVYKTKFDCVVILINVTKNVDWCCYNFQMLTLSQVVIPRNSNNPCGVACKPLTRWWNYILVIILWSYKDWLVYSIHVPPKSVFWDCVNNFFLVLHRCKTVSDRQN